MTEAAPPPPDRQVADAQHLRLLAIFHFVAAALAFLGIVFVLLQYVLFKSFMFDPDLWQGKEGIAPPPAMLALWKYAFIVMGIGLVAASAGNLLSALALRARKHRTFSLIVAGLDCLFMPVGTLLGAFTILVLVRESVVEAYEGDRR